MDIIKDLENKKEILVNILGLSSSIITECSNLLIEIEQELKIERTKKNSKT